MTIIENARPRPYLNAGAPTDGASGTYAGVAVAGALLVDTTNFVLYMNTGTQATPAWEPYGGGSAGATIEVYNETGGTLAAGSLVYLSGYDNTQDKFNVTKADADGAAGTEADYILPAAIDNNAAGIARKAYRLTGLATNGSAEGDPVYLDTTAGGWSLSAPTGADDVTQIVGRVAVVHASAGIIEFDLQSPQVVGTNNLRDGSVTLAKMAANSVDSDQYVDGSIDTAHFAAGAVDAAAMGADSVGDSELIDNTVSNAHISPFQGPPQHLTFEYDFAATGGGIGAQSLTLPAAGGALQIPDNFVITNAWLEGITVGASGGGNAGTMKLGITGNDDCFVGATAEDHAMFAADAVTALTNEVPLKTSAAVDVVGTIAGDAWTQGKFRVHVQGYEGA